jgi:periplasmic divalent cation tolerance protein
MSDWCVVLVTCPGDEADRLAQALVQERLAACVNTIPQVTSTYRWEGKLRHDREALLVIKTRRDRFESLRARVVELHSYDVPEVIALPIEAGHAPYLEWVTKEAAPP